MQGRIVVCSQETKPPHALYIYATYISHLFVLLRGIASHFVIKSNHAHRQHRTFAKNKPCVADAKTQYISLTEKLAYTMPTGNLPNRED